MRVCIFGSEIGLVKKRIFVGGAPVSAVRLGQALHDLGNEVFVFSSAPRGSPSRTERFDWGIIVNKRIAGRYLSLPYMFLYALTSFFCLWRLCRQNRIEVINSHGGHVFLSAVPSIVGKFLGVPVVHTQYCEVSRGRAGPRGLVDLLITRMCLTLPAKFVGISENVCASLLRTGLSGRKVEMIPPIVPSVDRSTNLTRRRSSFSGFDDTDLVALFVGNLKTNKGIDVLLEAFIELADELPRLKLIVTTELAHEAFDERRLFLQDKLRQHGLADRVTWVGFVDDILSLIGDADVLVVPFLDLSGISDYPLVVLEAMSVGTPVVATNVGGIGEILRKELGILIQPGNVSQLRNSLLRILENKEDRKSGGNANCLSLSHFHADTIGQEYRALFLQEVREVGRG
jgi:glycosyltransferase involved in cell wall biosynthesis